MVGADVIEFAKTKCSKSSQEKGAEASDIKGRQRRVVGDEIHDEATKPRRVRVISTQSQWD